MCLPSTCGECRHKTWWGCGNHVRAVMDKYDQSEWCTCLPKVEKDGKEYPPKGPKAD